MKPAKTYKRICIKVGESDMKMLINGNWTDSSSKETIDVTNPYDGSFLDTVPAATKEDVDKAIADAVSAQKVWNRIIIRERAKTLRKYLALLKKNREDLAKTLTLETGKPIFDSYGEIDSVYWKGKDGKGRTSKDCK